MRASPRAMNRGRAWKDGQLLTVLNWYFARATLGDFA